MSACMRLMARLLAMVTRTAHKPHPAHVILLRKQRLLAPVLSGKASSVDHAGSCSAPPLWSRTVGEGQRQLTSNCTLVQSRSRFPFCPTENFPALPHTASYAARPTGCYDQLGVLKNTSHEIETCIVSIGRPFSHKPRSPVLLGLFNPKLFTSRLECLLVLPRPYEYSWAYVTKDSACRGAHSSSMLFLFPSLVGSICDHAGTHGLYTRGSRALAVCGRRRRSHS
jgi:hypothetical protein